MTRSAEHARQRVADAVTFLFVPGNRPDRFAKAFLSSADVVIIDLEDAVPKEAKADARTATCTALSTPHAEIPGGQLQALVRVNNEPELRDKDLAALRQVAISSHSGLLGVMLPKVESAHQIVETASDLSGAMPGDGASAQLALIPLIESARGVVAATEIAEVPGVTRLAFGALDFASDVDASDPTVLDAARAHLVIASAAAGLVSPIDSPSVSVADPNLVRSEAVRSSALGFAAKLCIHPAQLEAVVEGFTPSAEQVEWATRVAALEGGATQLDGEMVDKPVVDRAKRILRRAHRTAQVDSVE